MPAFRQSIAALAATSICLMSTVSTPPADAQTYSPAVARSLAKTQKPPLHGQHWMAITGKPLGATAGAKIFERGGNAVDAACAMIAATSTMWDVLHWGGETQALIYDPRTKKVIAINGLGMAPTGATPEFFKGKGFKYPPAYGPLAAVTPGTPGGIILMLQEYGTLSLAEVLAPAIELADGYPIDGETADLIERWKDKLKEWPYSKQVMLPHLGSAREAPRAGEIFRQPDLAATLRKMVEAEKQALAAGKSRKEALQAAYDRFYRGDIAQEFVRGVQEQGGLITLDDLAQWQPLVEQPLSTSYRGVEVYKLDVWTQGPALLQSLNILENFDVRAMGYNSANYIHTVYQAMNLAFADRDFYYGDPHFPPATPTKGLLSKEYAKQRAATIRMDRNDVNAGPGDPYPFQGDKNPYADQLAATAQDCARCTGQGGAHGPATGGLRSGLQERHHHGDGRGRERLAGVGDAERRLGAGDDCRPHRHRPQPAHAVVRARRGREPLQRRRAGQASARHAHAEPRAQERQAVARLRRAGRRLAGPEPAAVLPERAGVRHDAAGSRRSRQLQQLPDEGVVRPARNRSRAASC